MNTRTRLWMLTRAFAKSPLIVLWVTLILHMVTINRLHNPYKIPASIILTILSVLCLIWLVKKLK